MSQKVCRTGEGTCNRDKRSTATRAGITLKQTDGAEYQEALGTWSAVTALVESTLYRANT